MQIPHTCFFFILTQLVRTVTQVLRMTNPVLRSRIVQTYPKVSTVTDRSNITRLCQIDAVDRIKKSRLRWNHIPSFSKHKEETNENCNQHELIDWLIDWSVIHWFILITFEFPNVGPLSLNFEGIYSGNWRNATTLGRKLKIGKSIHIRIDSSFARAVAEQLTIPSTHASMNTAPIDVKTYDNLFRLRFCSL